MSARRGTSLRSIRISTENSRKKELSRKMYLGKHVTHNVKFLIEASYGRGNGVRSRPIKVFGFTIPRRVSIRKHLNKITMRCIVVLTAVLAVIYAQAESKAVDHGLQQTLVAPMTSSAVVTLKPVSGEMTEIQSRNKRTPILLGKALLGGAVLGAGALGAGVLGAGALGVGLYKAKYLLGGYNGYGYGHGYPQSDYHYHYHSYPHHNYYPHYHYHNYGPSYY